MQLPPTAFFERIGDDKVDEDEEGTAIEDAESILDVAASLYRPARMLKWHYRSRHGSLIAFSNREFYKNELVVFPSPAPKSRSLGVKMVHVANGAFDTGRNRIEGQRIVKAALSHMEQHPGETLGIVAMNLRQSELIDELLQQELKHHPDAESYVSNPANVLEPLFVKNLENVQGDERDVIFISATYGRNAAGHFRQHLGPVNGVNGHRRLNVLFTRARKRVVLFSSMTADDIKIQAGSSRGVKALKGYLAYAATGVLDTALFSGREPHSDFELDVAAALCVRGLEVVAQVGVAGFFLDLAVRHPDKNDGFILGIECDGASYHSGVSARDRDRLRQTVLEDLGWNIHRIWSTDWFKQRDREVEKVLARVEQARRRSEPESDADEDWFAGPGDAIPSPSKAPAA
jgi:very-short-patch-repair endonuclease